MQVRDYADPILTCRAAGEFEAALLRDVEAQWSAMRCAGAALAQAVLQDYRELGEPPQHLQVLALVGKGHNGGDTLIACRHLLEQYPRARVVVVLSAAPDQLKLLSLRALNHLEGRVELIAGYAAVGVQLMEDQLEPGSPVFDICLDGFLGFNFKPPLREPLRSLISAVNDCHHIRLRAAVDLPSGQGGGGGSTALRADFCYATGIAKSALFAGNANCGRVRYLDLGFFEAGTPAPSQVCDFVLKSNVLRPLRRLRAADADKRSFGHLFVVGGSAGMSGALLMSVRAAVRSGVGLVTAFGPVSMVPALAAQVPEAMWVAWPEVENGSLSLSGLDLLWSRLDRASALVCGPGMGRSAEVDELVGQLVDRVSAPMLLDADALESQVLRRIAARAESWGPVVLTPHMGEYMRLAGLVEADFTSDGLRDFSAQGRVITVLKCAHTRICDGSSVLYNINGGPVLSRGGSGDLLAGLIGGQLAQSTNSYLPAVARAVVLHGSAAELLAREKGQSLVVAPELLDYLPQVLR